MQDEASFTSFFQYLRSHPDELSQWIVVGERIQDPQWKLPSVLHSLVTGLYGSCLLPEDTDCMLGLLQELTKLQIAKTDNPRR